MPVICDVCKTEVPNGTRFCPKCNIEIVPERERASRPPPMEKNVFDWGEPSEKPKAKDPVKRQQPDLEIDRTAELLDLVAQRLEAGQVLDASAIIKQVPAEHTRHPTFRRTFERLSGVIESRRQSIRERCQALTKAGVDCEQLTALLAGQASNEMESEQVCSLAIAAARSLYQNRRAEEAAKLLRLAPFRTLRDEQLVREHRELELQVDRMRARQHSLRSLLFIGSAMAAGSVGLALLALLVWRGETKVIWWLIAPAAVIAAIVAVYRSQIQTLMQRWMQRAPVRDRPARKLEQFLKDRQK